MGNHKASIVIVCRPLDALVTHSQDHASAKYIQPLFFSNLAHPLLKFPVGVDARAEFSMY